jgi:Selenophosphate synthase
MADGSGLTARLDYAAVPVLDDVVDYIGQGCVPGGTQRNFDSYGHRIAPLTDTQRALLCDPQTSGGLLVAVEPAGEAAFLAECQRLGLALAPIGEMVARAALAVEIR